MSSFGEKRITTENGRLLRLIVKSSSHEILRPSTRFPHPLPASNLPADFAIYLVTSWIPDDRMIHQSDEEQWSPKDTVRGGDH